MWGDAIAIKLEGFFLMTIGEALVLCLKTFTTPKYLVLMMCLYVHFSFLKYLPRGVAILIERPISSVCNLEVNKVSLTSRLGMAETTL